MLLFNCWAGWKAHAFRLKLVPKQFEVLPFLSAFTASWHESPRNPLCFCKEVYIYYIYKGDCA